MAPIFPVTGSMAVGLKLLSWPCAVWNGLSVDQRSPRFRVRFFVTFQSSWRYRLWMVSCGSQVVVYEVKFAARTYPSSNPASRLPVLGDGLPVGLQSGGHVVELEDAAGLAELEDNWRGRAASRSPL